MGGIREASRKEFRNSSAEKNIKKRLRISSQPLSCFLLFSSISVPVLSSQKEHPLFSPTAQRKALQALLEYIDGENRKKFCAIFGGGPAEMLNVRSILILDVNTSFI